MIMATNTKLDSLVINYLTQAQYNNAKREGTLNSNQIYMTPASSSNYTLPAATSSTLGGVKIGSNITVSNGTISLSKTNVTAALGYTPPTTDTKYTLPAGNASTLGGVKLSDSTSSTSSTNGGIAATPAAVKAAIAEAKLAAWPIGSIYMSVNSTNPASLFGGTWEALSERFLIGASSSYPAGSTGGSSTHTISKSELPSYTLADAVLANGTNSAKVTTSNSGWGIPNWKYGEITTGGDGNSFSLLPPYLSVWMWKRTK
jgi:hypothetical protein